MVQASKQVFGIEHSVTLKRIIMLSYAYKAQGRWKEAEDLLTQVLETSHTASGIEFFLNHLEVYEAFGISL